jgi:hypothetical protein
MKDYKLKCIGVAYVIGLNVNWLPISSFQNHFFVIELNFQQKKLKIQFFSQMPLNFYKSNHLH